MTRSESNERGASAPEGTSRSERGESFIDPVCFKGLCDALGDGVVKTDVKGVILEANAAFCTLIGYAREDVLGKTVLDFTPRSERARERESIRLLLKSGQSSREMEKGLLTADGRDLLVQASCWLQHDESGRAVALWGIFRDITERRSAENRARDNQEKYRFLAENATDVIWTMDDKGRYTYVSPSVERIRGFAPEEMIGMYAQDAVCPDSMEETRKAWERIEAEAEAASDRSPSPTVRVEVRLRKKDGSMIWGESMARRLRDAYGNPIGFIGTTRDITERKRIEERLRTSEHFLQALINATGDSVGLFQVDGTVLAMNRNMARFMGMQGDAAVGQNVFDFIPRSQHAMIRETFRRAVDTHTPMNRQVVWSGRILDGIIYPVLDGEETTAIAVYGRDVTEARFAEEARKKTQEQYRLIVETANEGILGLDANQVITYANKIVADFFGCRVEEVIGRSILDFMAPSEIEDNERRMEQRKVGRRERYERRFVRRDGAEVWGMISSTPLMAEDGRLLGAFAMIADITEVKQAHERLLNILDGISADVYVSDLETNNILFMNANMRDHYGLLEEGMACHKVIRDLDSRCPQCPKPELVDERGRPVGTLVSERYYEKLQRWHLNHDRAIRWLKGRLVHMHMAADITEIKTMAAELEKAMAKAEAASLAKNEFLANMSHEIRTPLNGLLGMLQLMQMSELAPLQRDYLDTALNSGRSLLQVLNDILDLSKVESGKLELEPIPFELGEVLDQVVSTFRHCAEERGVSMRWEIDETLPRHFVADKGRLRQILFNLVGNAVKFTESGSIEVRACPLDSGAEDGTIRLLFEVSDTGIGIPRDKVSTVFDPFTQVDGSSTRKYQGTGLGLGIVRRLVALMGGSITVDTEEGKGTSLYFTIRTRIIESPDDPAGGPAAGPENGALSILVAEDERVNRVVVQRILEKLGHRTVCVGSGEEALNILRERSFDLFLTDIQMPGLDGVATTRVIRNELKLDIPVIALTAHAMQGDRDRFIAAGMNGYVSKPFEIDSLQREIERVLGESES
ncbi:PAS/PAC sensor hybrid histidine kinase [Pseudodesulfovibrio mercurii]|uniref:Sensory/regulatory protein RpfC n=1 Tax=Pseudodesulfovibrio mercurii TaxID=641491 RepID=F0JCM7_9BACT|nr:PAS domain S-box protein [Pseudodesulfovibrio mercurii]EGB15707.1 PAS/PAC sensor hybrid histidine kinase [Pseudodesulfovibrio mercurii]